MFVDEGIFLLIMGFGSLYFQYNNWLFITEVIIITIFSAWSSYKYITMFMSILFEERKESTALVLLINYIILMLLYFFPVIIFKSSYFSQCIIEAIFFIISVLSLVWGWRVLKNQDM